MLGVVFLFTGWIITMMVPQLRYISWGMLGVGGILVLVAAILDYRRVGGALVSRRGRFSTGTTLMVSIFVGIILLVNAISIGNFYRFDTTGFAQYTLASQTKEMLANLDEDVEIIKFFAPNDSTGGAAYASSLLDEYENFTERLNIKLVDPDEHPDQARDHGITEYQRWFFSAYQVTAQTVVFVGSAGERFVGLDSIIGEAEHAFTSAILEVTGTVQKRIFFISGHNESSIFDTSSAGYSSAAEGLRDNLFQAGELNLLQVDLVPDDTAALVLAAPSPEIPLEPREMELIHQYLANKGRLMILGNPDTPVGLLELMGPWGLAIVPGTVIDPSSYTEPNKDSPSVPTNRNLFGLGTTYFPGAAAIIPLELPEGVNIETSPIILTSNESWLEKDSEPGVEPSFDEETEMPGPITIGALMETLLPPLEAGGEPIEDLEGTRIIAFGDSDFASNKHFFNGSNGNLFLNSINWLTAGTELISMDRKFLQTRRLILRPEARMFINYSSLALLPLFVFIAGGIIWYRRR